MLADLPGLWVLADFTNIYVALSGVRRSDGGRYPKERDERLFPLAEYVRRATIGAAVSREMNVLATNSDGSPARRQSLLDLLGPGSREEVVDPGRETVEDRLRDPDGTLSGECRAAVDRWYLRL